jgi:hypothetical protein
MLCEASALPFKPLSQSCVGYFSDTVYFMRRLNPVLLFVLAQVAGHDRHMPPYPVIG